MSTTVVQQAEGWYWVCEHPACGDANGPFPSHFIASTLGSKHANHRHATETGGLPTCATCGAGTSLAVSEQGVSVYVCPRCLVARYRP